MAVEATRLLYFVIPFRTDISEAVEATRQLYFVIPFRTDISVTVEATRLLYVACRTYNCVAVEVTKLLYAVCRTEICGCLNSFCIQYYRSTTTLEGYGVSISRVVTETALPKSEYKLLCTILKRS